jgi:hypothetical protein
VAGEATLLAELGPIVLVSADKPLKGFIPLLTRTPYRLVVRGSRIEGIVTRGDVHKLPVRLFVFALVTHLEMTMAELIRRTSIGDDWFTCLGKARQKKVEEKLNRLQDDKVDPPLLELTEFCDKRDVLKKKGLLGSGSPLQNKAVREFSRIEGLRNKVAHASSYAQDESDFRDFVRQLELTEEWIRTFSRAANGVTAVEVELEGENSMAPTSSPTAHGTA